MAEGLVTLPVFGADADLAKYLLQCKSINFYSFNTDTTGVQNTTITTVSFSLALIFQLSIGIYHANPAYIFLKNGNAYKTGTSMTNSGGGGTFLQISASGTKLNLYSGSTTLRNFDGAVGLAVIE